jgi:hypothetical protein
MSALANTIRQLSGRLALLRAERERYQALCVVAFQLAGAVGASARLRDAFADGAHGAPEARQKANDLLPVDPKEIGDSHAWSDAEVEGWKRDAEKYRSLYTLFMQTDVYMGEASLKLRVTGACPKQEEFYAAIDGVIAQQQEANHE